MSDEVKIEKHYQARAEEIIDLFFDNGCFAKELTRKDMRAMEDLLAYYLQSGAESARRAEQLLRKVRNI